MNTVQELISRLPTNERIGAVGDNYKVEYKNGFKAFVKRNGKHTYKLAVVDPENPFQASILEGKSVKQFHIAVKRAYKNQVPTHMKRANLTFEEKNKWNIKNF